MNCKDPFNHNKFIDYSNRLTVILEHQQLKSTVNFHSDRLTRCIDLISVAFQKDFQIIARIKPWKRWPINCLWACETGCHLRRWWRLHSNVKEDDTMDNSIYRVIRVSMSTTKLSQHSLLRTLFLPIHPGHLLQLTLFMFVLIILTLFIIWIYYSCNDHQSCSRHLHIGIIKKFLIIIISMLFSVILCHLTELNQTGDDSNRLVYAVNLNIF